MTGRSRCQGTPHPHPALCISPCHHNKKPTPTRGDSTRRLLGGACHDPSIYIYEHLDQVDAVGLDDSTNDTAFNGGYDISTGEINVEDQDGLDEESTDDEDDDPNKFTYMC